jgi:hypothetical protein
MRVVRPTLCLAAVGVVAVVLPASAAAPPKYVPKVFSYSDVANDANGINDQGLLSIVTDSAPDNVAGGQPNGAFDILKVAYTSTGTMVKKGKKYFPQCTGFTVKLTVGGAPATGQAVYRISASSVVNDLHWWLEYADGVADLRFGHTDSNETTGGTDDTVTLTTPAKLDGSSITLTVTDKDLKASGEKLTAIKMSGLSAEVRSKAGVDGAGFVTVPKWDDTPVTEGPVKPC